MKKLLALTLAVLMALSLAACGGQSSAPAQESKEPEAAEPAEPAAQTFTIGICQLVQHPALDAATQGFKDAVVEALGEGNVTFQEQNASGDSATCTTVKCSVSTGERSAPV